MTRQEYHRAQQLARIRAALCEESAVGDLDVYARLVQDTILRQGPVWIPPGHPAEGLPEGLPRYAPPAKKRARKVSTKAAA